MRHLNGYNRLGRESSHRMAMLRNMATSLVISERLSTTLAKARALRSFVERLVSLGTRGDLHARRQVAAACYSDEAVAKLFTELAKRFRDRPGGYTRILKTGNRKGDGGRTATIEFVDYVESGDAEVAEEAPSSKKKDK